MHFSFCISRTESELTLIHMQESVEDVTNVSVNINPHKSELSKVTLFSQMLACGPDDQFEMT